MLFPQCFPHGMCIHQHASSLHCTETSVPYSMRVEFLEGIKRCPENRQINDQIKEDMKWILYEFATKLRQNEICRKLCEKFLSDICINPPKKYDCKMIELVFEINPLPHNTAF